MKKILGILLIVFVTQLAFGQDEKPQIEWKDGKKYFVHFVQQGNTLYGLTKLYAVTAEEILAENPEVAQGLKTGQKLMIPAPKMAVTKEEKEAPKTVQKVEINSDEVVHFQRTHEVVKTETLFGIAKKYNLTVDELVKANPGTDKGINLGQILNIPNSSSVAPPKKGQNKVIFYDTIIEHKVLGHETVYSISKRFMISTAELTSYNNIKNLKVKEGDVLKIPLKKEKISTVEVRAIEDIAPKDTKEKTPVFKSKNTYNIVYLLPFGFDKKDPLSGVSTEFVMGAQIAIDSLKALGLNATITFMDAPNDTLKLKAILDKSELKAADLIIGPFIGTNLEYVAKWCKSQKIRFVSPIVGQTTVLKNNPYAYNFVTSDITLMKGMATYIIENHPTENIILVKTQEKDQELYQAFRQKFMQLSLEGSKQKLVELEMNQLATFIQKGNNYVIVMPSRDKGNSLKFINQLNTAANKAGSGTITLFGTKEWSSFDEIKGYYKNKYNLHFPISNDFNYSYPATIDLLYKIRKNYNSDLTKYGTQGFDVTFYAIGTFLMGKPQSIGVMNHINFVSTGTENGQENSTTFIIQQKDFDLLKVGTIK